MGNLKDIQDITGLTSEAIFNIRKPVDYMCSDIDSHIKDIRTQCDYIMDGDEEDVKYYSKSIKSDVDSYFEDIRSKVENQAKISHPSQPEAGGVTKILDTNIHESGRCGNGSGSRERNDRDSGLRGGKGLPACGDRPSIL